MERQLRKNHIEDFIGEKFLTEWDLEKKKKKPQGSASSLFKQGRLKSLVCLLQALPAQVLKLPINLQCIITFPSEKELNVQSENAFEATYTHCFSFFCTAPL